jgi:hypothetical protein
VAHSKLLADLAFPNRAKAFNESRLRQKKLHSAKKQSRKGGYD